MSCPACLAGVAAIPQIVFLVTLLKGNTSGFSAYLAAMLAMAWKRTSASGGGGLPPAAGHFPPTPLG